MDVGDWLRNLGLEQYAAAFRDNAIDAGVLPSLTAEDLRELGVALVGHRRRLLDAIAALAQEQAVVGETPNLAARLQGLAEPNAIVIADATRRQIGGLFELRDMGPQALKGFAAEQVVWRVVGESGVASRFEALRSGETPLVGRDEEIDLLLRRWAQAKAGEGRVVLVSAEPGIGKSRLAEAVEERIAAEPHTRLRYFCSPHHQDSALYPVIGQLERAAGFSRDDSASTKHQKLAALLADSPPDALSLVAELLSLPAIETRSELELTPQRRKEQTFEALLGGLERLSRRQPVLMLFEDLHWMDASTRELLDRAITRVESWPVLLVATFRPEFDPPWTGLPHVTMLALNRLGRRDGALLVAQLVGNAGLPGDLPADLIAEIVERTDGVPLFLEEVTKVVLETAAGSDAAARGTLAAIPGARLAVPATLQASLMARLDRLGPAAKEVAQIGAAIGREFPYELLSAIAPRGDKETQAALARLVAAGLVFQRGAPPTAEYQFKHALVQDTAYGTLLRGPRRALHGRIAAAISEGFSDIAERQPELLAHHLTGAGLVEKSVAFWGMAGRRSAARSAMAEAATQLQKGLEQLALLPDTPERQRQELEFRSALGAALQAVKGFAAPETGDAYARARELWEQLGSPSEFLQVPYGQALYYMFRGELDLAQRLAEDLLRVSGQRNDSAGLVLGHSFFGQNSALAGKFASSRSHLEAGLALYDPIYHHGLGHQAGIHPPVAIEAFLGFALFCLGFPDQALARSNAAIAEARRLAHPQSLAGAFASSTRLLSLVGDDAALDERADQMVAVATEQGFPFQRALGTVYRGWLRVKSGDVAEGISLLRSGTTAFRATGSGTWGPYHLALLAAACEIAGQIAEAANLLEEALQVVERTGERWFAAELNRLKGQLLLRQGHTEAAEELYRKALSIAEEQEAKMWELRAAASLARLWRDQGRTKEARDLLAPVYGWFTEGFDTPDLVEAKALLDALS